MKLLISSIVKPSFCSEWLNLIHGFAFTLHIWFLNMCLPDAWSEHWVPSKQNGVNWHPRCALLNVVHKNYWYADLSGWIYIKSWCGIHLCNVTDTLCNCLSLCCWNSLMLCYRQIIQWVVLPAIFTHICIYTPVTWLWYQVMRSLFLCCVDLLLFYI